MRWVTKKFAAADTVAEKISGYSHRGRSRKESNVARGLVNMDKKEIGFKFSIRLSQNLSVERAYSPLSF